MVCKRLCEYCPPLNRSIKNDGFKWLVEVDQSFRQLEMAMSSIPVLARPNFNRSFILETNAFSHGLGAVLMQNHRPNAFFSHALPPRACQKSVYQKELMAIVFTVQKWGHYLLGNKFIVRTDQRNLKFLLE